MYNLTLTTSENRLLSPLAAMAAPAFKRAPNFAMEFRSAIA